MSKKLNYQTEEQKEMVHFLMVLGVIVVLVIGVYFVSKFFVMDQSLFEVTYQDGVINDDRAIVGTIFNRPESEYYVVLYDETAPSAVYYSAITTKYAEEEDAFRVYHVDLNNELNRAYYVGEEGTSNKKATKVSEIKLKDLTLIKIKNGKIVKYLETLEEIEKELAVTE